AQPESGEVLWQGRPIRLQLSCFHQNMAWLGHRAGLKGDLTLAENLSFDAALRQSAPKPAMAHLLERLGIAERADVAARGLSAGQRRRTALCRVLMSEAPLWLLDEPFTNLDANGQALVRELLVAHSRAGGAAIFAAHADVSLDGVAVRRFEWHADG
ncbi:MAG: heme ABC exporter ATP-binding protein CcmA, partial [Pseudomonadota bacterium]